jgi:hypothetical protein
VTRYRPGDTPPPGTYVSLKGRRIERIREEGQALSGSADTSFRPVPPWAAPFVGVGGAILGGLYVVFMPVIFAGMTLYYAGVGVGRLVRAGSRRLAANNGATDAPPPPR